MRQETWHSQQNFQCLNSRCGNVCTDMTNAGVYISRIPHRCERESISLRMRTGVEEKLQQHHYRSPSKADLVYQTVGGQAEAACSTNCTVESMKEHPSCLKYAVYLMSEWSCFAELSDINTTFLTCLNAPALWPVSLVFAAKVNIHIVLLTYHIKRVIQSRYKVPEPYYQFYSLTHLTYVMCHQLWAIIIKWGENQDVWSW